MIINIHIIHYYTLIRASVVFNSVLFIISCEYGNAVFSREYREKYVYWL